MPVELSPDPPIELAKPLTARVLVANWRQKATSSPAEVRANLIVWTIFKKPLLLSCPSTTRLVHQQFCLELHWNRIRSLEPRFSSLTSFESIFHAPSRVCIWGVHFILGSFLSPSHTALPWGKSLPMTYNSNNALICSFYPSALFLSIFVPPTLWSYIIKHLSVFPECYTFFLLGSNTCSSFHCERPTSHSPLTWMSSLVVQHLTYMNISWVSLLIPEERVTCSFSMFLLALYWLPFIAFISLCCNYLTAFLPMKAS